VVYRTFYRLSVVVVVDDVASVIIIVSLLSNSFYMKSLSSINCLAIVNSVSVPYRNNK